MTDRLASEADLAEILGITEERVAELRRRHKWPHVRLGRTFRFTQAHIDQIIALHSASTPEPSSAVVVAGQTSRSQARRRSA